VRADVADESGVVTMVAAGEKAFGGIDILVNNAGLARGKWSEGLDLSAEDWMRILAVNTLAPLLCARACRASMVARGGGVIVNQTSMAAYMETGAYSVTKLALVGITNVLAAELGGDNIRVNAIGPGVITGKIPPDLLQTTLAMQKLRPQGNPDDLVGALLFLCSDRSSFVTGQTILVDGGAIRGRV
jgi:3-oxoacyl-[acyl-carrier protein] reductase